MPVTFFAQPVGFPVITFFAGVPFGRVPVAIFAIPIGLLVIAFIACIAFGSISVAIPATPIGFLVATLTPISLGVIEVTVVASPTGLLIATFASISLGHVPPVGLIHASSTSFHGVASGVADMAGRAGPVGFLVLAFRALVPFLYSLFAVFAVPLHLQDILIYQIVKFIDGFVSAILDPFIIISYQLALL